MRARSLTWTTLTAVLGTLLLWSASASAQVTHTFLPQGVAVNHANVDIYVSDGEQHVVDVFKATGEYISQLTETPLSAPVSGPFRSPYGLAFDQATENLYVTDPDSGVVDVFSASGEYVSQFG